MGPKIDFIISLLSCHEVCELRRNERIFDLACREHGQNHPFRGKTGHFEISLEPGREEPETRRIERIFGLVGRKVGEFKGGGDIFFVFYVFFPKKTKKNIKKRFLLLLF